MLISDTFQKGSWINITNPTEEELSKIVRQFDLDEGLIEDSLDQYEVPRYERIDDNRYIYTRYPIATGSEITTHPITIVIGSNFVITITTTKCDSIDYLKATEITTTQKTKLLIYLLDNINDRFEKYVHSINKKVNSLSSKIEKIKNQEIKQLVINEKVLNEFLAALLPTSLIFTRLLNSKSLELFEDDEELIEDMQQNTQQLIEICKNSLKYIGNIRESYTTILSNNLNKTMKFLTGITVVLTIPTIITSFYGMNVHLPFETHPLAFILVILVTILFSSIITIILLKNEML